MTKVCDGKSEFKLSVIFYLRSDAYYSEELGLCKQYELCPKYTNESKKDKTILVRRKLMLVALINVTHIASMNLQFANVCLVLTVF